MCNLVQRHPESFEVVNNSKCLLEILNGRHMHWGNQEHVLKANAMIGENGNEGSVGSLNRRTGDFMVVLPNKADCTKSTRNK